MSVWKSDETLLSICILEVRQKYSAARRIFNSLLGVSSGDETLHLMFDILHHTFASTVNETFFQVQF